MKYRVLTSYYSKIESTSKRLDKIVYISELLQQTDSSEIKEILFLLQGSVFAAWDEQKLGVASRLVLKAIHVSTGLPESSIEAEWKKTGDLGVATEHMIAKKSQATLFSQELEVKKVFDNLVKLANLGGSGTVSNKVALLSELLTSAKPDEAKYIVRTVLGDLRVGASTGTLRDAIVRAYFTEVYDSRDSDDVMKVRFKELVRKIQHAYDLSNDFSVVVEKLLKNGEQALEEITLSVGKPVNPMLFPKAKDVEDAFSIVGKPAIIEYKYDGFRVQIHKKGDSVQLFTRRLESVTNQFPDVVKRIKENVLAEECILDSEVLGINLETNQMLPFQHISQRIRRKYDVSELVKKVPVINIIFDVMQLNGTNLLSEPFGKRRELLQKIILSKDKQIQLSESIITDNPGVANEFYQKSLLLGHEGVMVKSLEKGYKPGARVGHAVKLKPVLEPLDLIITGAEWGQGKRTGWLTSFMLACKRRDGEFVNIGKVGTGVKELDSDDPTVTTFKQFTRLLKPLIMKEEGHSIVVKPEVIVEVDYEEIQRSSNYASGYALRFPRIKRIRADLKEPASISDVERIYTEQRGRN